MMGLPALLTRPFGAALALAILAATSVAGEAAPTTLKATYSIVFGIVTIGRANVDARFTDRGYAAAISGSTFGVVRLVSDASASLNGSGRLRATSVSPNTYSLDTSEGNFHTRVRMGLRNGAVTSVDAIPDQVQADDRVPLTSAHKRDVVDPVGAFIVALDGKGEPTGPEACNRTVRVFDGWQRYDVQLTYKETRPSSAGDSFVCTARYVPVAGYRPSLDSVRYMATNKRLEVVLVPVTGTRVLVPYRILIGTKYGDLVIKATDFTVDKRQRQANAD
jgi:hypothetical protein